jgi:hypothetical protein
MRVVIALYALSMLYVGAIVAVALIWCRLSMLHALQGPFIVSLTRTHGIHVLDLVTLAIELALLLLLTLTLLAGFSRGR